MRYLLNFPSKNFNDWAEKMYVDAIKIPKCCVVDTHHLQMIWLKEVLLIDYNRCYNNMTWFNLHGDQFLQAILQKKLKWK